MSTSAARIAAYEILLRVEREDSYAVELLHSASFTKLTSADHGLATELVMGILRWRSGLDTAIARSSSQRLHKLDDEVLTALRLGAYQLGWLDRIPARAAIHESVELVKRARKRSAVPFVNAILRKLSESLPRGQSQLDSITTAETPSSLAIASAHPEWLVQRWSARFGFAVTRQICRHTQSIPVTAIRLRSTSAQEELRRAGIGLTPGSFLINARRVLSGDVTKTQPCQEGNIAIQDEASQLVAALVGQGKRILDCCAAPGGKTWAIADCNPNASIVALELHAHRAKLLRKRVPSSNVQVVTSDIREFPLSDPYDCVLVDAPCSGTGTLARNPEIKWRLQPADLADLRSRQLAILSAAMMHVAPRGKLVYATCSLEKEEGESVADEALQNNKFFHLRNGRDEIAQLRAQGLLSTDECESLVDGPYLRTIPGIHPCDGFFVAMLGRE
jgi:16S rRNA (cytosine967-C5)-methyltransferase